MTAPTITETQGSQQTLDTLAAAAGTDNYPEMERRAAEFLDLVPVMLDADAVELTTARTMPSDYFQMRSIFRAVQQQGDAIIVEVNRLQVLIRAHLLELAGCSATPAKMLTIGESWRHQSTKVTDMIDVAVRLSDQPNWQGQASQAHLAALPKQITALRKLKDLADTAAESVLLVGAIQSNVFYACSLMFIEASTYLRGHVSPAPTSFFSRSASIVTLLTNLDILLKQWISGEGTWQPSAAQIAEGLAATTTGSSFEWPRSVVRVSAFGTSEWRASVTEDGVSIQTRPVPSLSAAAAVPADPAAAAASAPAPSISVPTQASPSSVLIPQAPSAEPQATPESAPAETKSASEALPADPASAGQPSPDGAGEVVAEEGQAGTDTPATDPVAQVSDDTAGDAPSQSASPESVASHAQSASASLVDAQPARAVAEPVHPHAEAVAESDVTPRHAAAAPQVQAPVGLDSGPAQNQHPPVAVEKSGPVVESFAVPSSQDEGTWYDAFERSSYGTVDAN